MELSADARRGPPYLNLLCLAEKAGWRLMVEPRWVPEFLAALFDVNGEVAPVWLDLADLERSVARAGVEIEKRVTKYGSVELTAKDTAAETLARWLSTAIMSGTRPRSPAQADDSGTDGGSLAG